MPDETTPDVLAQLEEIVNGAAAEVVTEVAAVPDSAPLQRTDAGWGIDPTLLDPKITAWVSAEIGPIHNFVGVQLTNPFHPAGDNQPPDDIAAAQEWETTTRPALTEATRARVTLLRQVLHGASVGDDQLGDLIDGAAAVERSLWTAFGEQTRSGQGPVAAVYAVVGMIHLAAIGAEAATGA